MIKVKDAYSFNSCAHLHYHRAGHCLGDRSAIAASPGTSSDHPDFGVGDRRFDLSYRATFNLGTLRAQTWNDMAEPNGNQRLTVKTAFGEISTSGGIVFLVISLTALTAVSIWEHYQRHIEHEALECAIKLNTFLYTIPRGTTVTWEQIPTEYWPCLPPTIVNRMKNG